jgi:hypothetical protein
MNDSLSKPSAEVGGDLLLKVAKNLQGGHSKHHAGEAAKWKDIPADEKKLWIRLARRAATILGGTESQPG